MERENILDKINEVLNMLLEGSIDLENAASNILDILNEVIEVKEVENKKEEDDNDDEEDNEEEKEMEVEEVKNSNNKIIEAQVFPKDEINDIDKKAIEYYYSHQKPMGIKIPMKYEHLNDMNSEVIDIVEKEDGYYAVILLKDDIKEIPYLSAGIDVIKEEDNEYAILKEISFTSNPKKNVKRIDIPELVYSNTPKFIREVIYSLPNSEKIIKKLSYFPNKKKVEEKRKILNLTEEQIRRSLRMI